MVVKKDGVRAWAAPLQIPDPTTATAMARAGVSRDDGERRARAASMIHPVATGTARSSRAAAVMTTIAPTRYPRTPRAAR